MCPEIPDPLYGLLPEVLYPLTVGRAFEQAHQPPNEATDQDLDPESGRLAQGAGLNELLHYEFGPGPAARPISDQPGEAP